MKNLQHFLIYGVLAVAVAAATPSVQSQVQTTGKPGSGGA